MLAQRITTHIRDALARFLQEYKAIPQQFTLPLLSQPTPIDVSILGAVVASLTDQIQLLENAIFALDESRQLFNGTTFPAMGAQLDGIGTLVGISRNGLSDAEYLIFILGQIAANTSDTTIDTMTTIASLLFQVTTLLAFDMPPSEFNFQIPDDSPLQESLYLVVANILHNAMGAGIGLGFISLFNEDGFRFTTVGGPQIGGGFSSAAVFDLPMDNVTHDMIDDDIFLAIASAGSDVQTGFNVHTSFYPNGTKIYVQNPFAGKNILLDGGDIGGGFVAALSGPNNWVVTITDNGDPNGMTAAITTDVFPTYVGGGGFAKNIYNNSGV